MLLFLLDDLTFISNLKEYKKNFVFFVFSFFFVLFFGYSVYFFCLFFVFFFLYFCLFVFLSFCLLMNHMCRKDNFIREIEKSLHPFL